MAERENDKPDVNGVIEDLQRLDDIADRVRIAGFGLAAPLLKMRESQMRREVVRVAAKKGKEHPEVAARIALYDRTAQRRAAFNEELSRARIDRAELTGDDTAGIWGRVADDGKPVDGLIVSAFADNERADFRCTDENGAFAMEVPADAPVTLSVRSADGAVLYRDPESAVLKPGEQRFREIDLTRGPAVPCPEPDDRPEDPTFPMIDLVGQKEADAMAVIRAQGLKLGKRSERDSPDRVGRVIEQDPQAGTPVERRAAVSIVVGRSAEVAVPNVVGMTLERAQVSLKKAELGVGQISRVPVVDDKVGLVINQDPKAGSNVSRGEPVSLQVGVKRGIEFVRVTALAEERLRKDDVDVDDEPGFLSQRLKAAGVSDVSDLEGFLKEKPSTIRDRLELPNLKITRKVISTLKRALKDIVS